MKPEEKFVPVSTAFVSVGDTIMRYLVRQYGESQVLFNDRVARAANKLGGTFRFKTEKVEHYVYPLYPRRT